MTAVWTVTEIDELPTYEGKTRVVANVGVIVSDVSTWTQKVGLNYSSVGTDPNYTDWGDLTQDQILTWVKASLGADMVAHVEAQVAQEPPSPDMVETNNLPWAAE
jgi:hypothetical protein